MKQIVIVNQIGRDEILKTYEAIYEEVVDLQEIAIKNQIEAQDDLNYKLQVVEQKVCVLWSTIFSTKCNNRINKFGMDSNST